MQSTIIKSNDSMDGLKRRFDIDLVNQKKNK